MRGISHFLRFLSVPYCNIQFYDDFSSFTNLGVLGIKEVKSHFSIFFGKPHSTCLCRFSQSEMRLLEILVFVGFCLAFIKAESNADEKLDDSLDDQPAEESFLEDEPTNTAEESPLNEEPKEQDRRRLLPRVIIPIGIPSNINKPFFRVCYCFRFRCKGKCDVCTFNTF